MTEHILHIETRRLFVGAQKLAQGLKLTVPSPTLPQTKLSAHLVKGWECGKGLNLRLHDALSIGHGRDLDLEGYELSSLPARPRP